MSVNDATGVFAGVELVNNTADKGGALFISETVVAQNSVLLSASTIAGNKAAAGGGVYVASPISVQNCILTTNHAVKRIFIMF